MKNVWLGCWLLIGAAVVTGCSRAPDPAAPVTNLAGRKVLLIVASRDFQDVEYNAVREQLDACRATVTVASSTPAPARGMNGMTVTPALTVAQARAADYDGIVFIGGPGSQEYWNDPAAHALVRDAVAQGKVVGAICLAPVILARAGVLQGKRATVWPDQCESLRTAGAIDTRKLVEADGTIVTGQGPAVSQSFAHTVAYVLSGETVSIITN